MAMPFDDAFIFATVTAYVNKVGAKSDEGILHCEDYMSSTGNAPSKKRPGFTRWGEDADPWKIARMPEVVVTPPRMQKSFCMRCGIAHAGICE